MIKLNYTSSNPLGLLGNILFYIEIPRDLSFPKDRITMVYRLLNVSVTP